MSKRNLPRMALLAAICWGAAAAPPVKIVLVAGTPSHGAGEHEFNAGTMLLAKCLRQNPGVDAVVVKGGWPADDAVFAGANSIVLYMDGGENHPLLADDHLATMGKLMKRGVGRRACTTRWKCRATTAGWSCWIGLADSTGGRIRKTRSTTWN